MSCEQEGNESEKKNIIRAKHIYNPKGDLLDVRSDILAMVSLVCQLPCPP